MPSEKEKSPLYVWLKKLARWMDDYYLDPIIGLVPGAGDVVTAISGVPSVALSLFVVKSLPLTLAVTFNILLDVAIGCIPFLGEIGDFFFRSHKKNIRLIQGYILEDQAVIREVRKKAIAMGFGIVLMIGLIIALIWGIGELFKLFEP